MSLYQINEIEGPTYLLDWDPNLSNPIHNPLGTFLQIFPLCSIFLVHEMCTWLFALARMIYMNYMWGMYDLHELYELREYFVVNYATERKAIEEIFDLFLSRY